MYLIALLQFLAKVVGAFLSGLRRGVLHVRLVTWRHWGTRGRGNCSALPELVGAGCRAVGAWELLAQVEGTSVAAAELVLQHFSLSGTLQDAAVEEGFFNYILAE